MARHKMIVIDGVRYRPEDVPEPADEQAGGDPEQPQDEPEVTHKARRPAPAAKRAGGRRGTAT